MSAKQGLTQLSTQLHQLLKRIDTPCYQAKLELLDGGTIGQHVRHILDFYNCLLHGLSSGVVDYADRKRDPQVEIDPAIAAKMLSKISTQLNLLEETTPLLMRGDFIPYTESERPLYPTCIGRELTFIHDHAVHHMALIKVGLNIQCPEANSDTHFGVAPSTLRYRSTQQA